MMSKETCPHRDSCELYGRFVSKAILMIWKSRFCDTTDAYVDCARYQLSEAHRPVPATLLPNGKHIHVL